MKRLLAVSMLFATLGLARCAPAPVELGGPADGGAGDLGSGEGSEPEVPEGSLEVLPRRLFFGAAGLGGFVERSVALLNPGGTAVAVELSLAGSGAFTASAAPARLGPGATAEVELRFAPETLGPHAAALRLTRAGGAALEVALEGEGAAPASCAPSLVPDQLNFGGVQRTRSLRRFFELRNPGPATCVYEVEFLALGPPECSWAGPAGQRLVVPPRSAESFVVELGPLPSGCRCRAAVVIRTGGEEVGRLEATGVSGSSDELLVVPEELDFGAAAPGGHRARRVVLYNTGSVPRRVLELRVEGEAFRVSPPSVNAVVEPGETLDLEVELSAPAPGRYAGTIELDWESAGSCGSPGTVATRVIFLTGTAR